MEENIVGFTLIFTLILWIPAALALHCCVSCVLIPYGTESFRTDLHAVLKSIVS